MSTRVGVSCCWLALALAACAPRVRLVALDATSDASVDATSDAPVDAPLDAPSADASLDASLDALADAPDSAPFDAPADAPADTPADAPGAEAAREASVDAAPDAPPGTCAHERFADRGSCGDDGTVCGMAQYCWACRCVARQPLAWHAALGDATPQVAPGIGSNVLDEVTSVALLDRETACVAGAFDDALLAVLPGDDAPRERLARAGSHSYVACLRRDRVLWARALAPFRHPSAASLEESLGVAVARRPAGGLVVAGTYTAGFELTGGAEPLRADAPAEGTEGVFVLELDATGAPLQLRTLPGEGLARVTSVSSLADGGVTVSWFSRVDAMQRAGHAALLGPGPRLVTFRATSAVRRHTGADLYALRVARDGTAWLVGNSTGAVSLRSGDASRELSLGAERFGFVWMRAPDGQLRTRVVQGGATPCGGTWSEGAPHLVAAQLDGDDGLHVAGRVVGATRVLETSPPMHPGVTVLEPGTECNPINHLALRFAPDFSVRYAVSFGAHGVDGPSALAVRPDGLATLAGFHCAESDMPAQSLGTRMLPGLSRVRQTCVDGAVVGLDARGRGNDYRRFASGTGLTTGAPAFSYDELRGVDALDDLVAVVGSTPMRDELGVSDDPTVYSQRGLPAYLGVFSR